jgi:hypothetical protein
MSLGKMSPLIQQLRPLLIILCEGSAEEKETT